MVADDAMDREKGKHNSRGEPKLSAQAIATWPTAAARDYRSEEATDEFNQKRWAHPRGKPLSAMVMAQWPTPTSSSKGTENYNEAGNSAGLVAIRKHAIAATWATPKVVSGDYQRTPDGRTILNLSGQVRTAKQWATPQARDGTQRGNQAKRFLNPKRSNDLPDEVMLISNGSSAPTEKRGALNPEFVCWLMGYPPEYLNCAPSATRSTGGRQRRSSKA